MPASSQSFASSPVRARSIGSAQAAAAHAVLDRPKVEALFPQLDKAETSLPVLQRVPSRASCSEPLAPSSFGRAAPSELSAATTAFIPASLLGDQDASAAAPYPERAKITQNLEMVMPYRTDAESSVVSDWRMHYWREAGKGIKCSRGLRCQELRFGNENSPGVCVLRQQDDLPKVPGINGVKGDFGPVVEKQFIIDAVNKQLLQLGVTLTDPRNKKDKGESTISGSRISTQQTDAKVHAAATRSPGMGRKAGSEASIGSQKERRHNLAAVVARDRYQRYVVANPKKGHRHCTPQLSTGAGV